MSKKIKSYNLSKNVIAAISSKAEADDRKDSDWLNRFLTAELVEVEIKPVKAALVKPDVAQNMKSTYIPMFDQFWDMYDKKKARPKCEGLWKKLTGKELELIFNNLPNYVLSTPDKQYRSNPETWLRNKGWNDEVITNERHENNTPKLSAYERQVKRNDELYRQPNECELGMGAASGHLGGAMDEGTGRATIEHVDTGTFVDYE